eukprot:470546_1
MSQDITNLASDISGDITGLASDISGDITGLASDISGDMTQLGSNLAGDITSLGTTMTNHLNAIGSTAGQIKGIATANNGELNSILNEKIPIINDDLDNIITDVKKIKDLLTNPFSVLPMGNDIKSLGNTLKVCLDDLTSAMFGDLPIPDLLEAVDILDMDFDTIIYQIIA